VITELNGKKMDNSGQLQAAISAQASGKQSDASAWMREGKSVSVPLTLEAINKRNNETASRFQARRMEKRRWGVGLQETHGLICVTNCQFAF